MRGERESLKIQEISRKYGLNMFSVNRQINIANLQDYTNGYINIAAAVMPAAS